MTDTIRQSAFAELVARYAAYTFPDLGDGAGTWTVKCVKENPEELQTENLPAIFLFSSYAPSSMELENVSQWLVTQPCQVTLRISRYKEPQVPGKRLIDYLRTATIKNTSGTVDFTLGGYAMNVIINEGRVVIGSSMEPFIDIELLFDVQILEAIGDPTAIV